MSTTLEALHSSTAGLLVTWPGNLFIENGSEEHKIYLRTLALNEEEILTGTIRPPKMRQYEWRKIGVGLIHRIPLMSFWKKGKLLTSPKTYNIFYKKQKLQEYCFKINNPIFGAYGRIFDIQDNINCFRTKVNFPYVHFNGSLFQAVSLAYPKPVDHLILPVYEILRVFLFAHSELTKQLFYGNLWDSKPKRGFCMTENLDYVKSLNEKKTSKPRMLLESKLYEDKSNALLRILYDPYAQSVAKTLTSQYLKNGINLFKAVNTQEDAPLIAAFPLSWPLQITVAGKLYQSTKFGSLFIGHEIKAAEITAPAPITSCEIDFINDHNTIINFIPGEDSDKDNSTPSNNNRDDNNKTVKGNAKASNRSATSVTPHECIATDNIEIQRNLRYSVIECEVSDGATQEAESEPEQSSTDESPSGDKEIKREVGKPDKSKAPEPLVSYVFLIKALLVELNSKHNISLKSNIVINEVEEVEGIAFSTFQESRLWSRDKPTKKLVAILQLSTSSGAAYLLEPLRFQKENLSRTYLFVKGNFEPISEDEIAILIVKGLSSQEEVLFLDKSKVENSNYRGYRYNHHPLKEPEKWAVHVTAFLKRIQKQFQKANK